MKIDPTTTVSGGELYDIEIDVAEVTAALSPEPSVLSATLEPNTVSISHMFVDNGSAGDPESPGTDSTEFFGVTSIHLGFGGAPPYLTCYPLGGLT